jgi:hypothetical protein
MFVRIRFRYNEEVTGQLHAPAVLSAGKEPLCTHWIVKRVKYNI